MAPSAHLGHGHRQGVVPVGPVPWQRAPELSERSTTSGLVDPRPLPPLSGPLLGVRAHEGTGSLLLLVPELASSSLPDWGRKWRWLRLWLMSVSSVSGTWVTCSFSQQRSGSLTRSKDVGATRNGARAHRRGHGHRLRSFRRRSTSRPGWWAHRGSWTSSSTSYESTSFWGYRGNLNSRGQV